MATLTAFLKTRMISAFRLTESELPSFLWSFLYFFAIMASNYILRPLRDEIGILSGVDNLKWVFTASFAVMAAVVPLFGWLTRRFHRARLLPGINLFFAANLVLFYLLFHTALPTVWTGRAFFVWNSVFNLFVISIFWSFMSDLFSLEQAGRLFATIAAGGSAGAIAGPLITSLLVTTIGPLNLLLIPVGLLLVSVVAINALSGRLREENSGADGHQRDGPEAGLAGGLFSGALRVFRSPFLMGIVLFIFLYTALSTVLYFEQAHIIRDAVSDSARRTRLFSLMDLAVNLLTILAQIFITSRIVKRLGLSFTLALIPALLAGGLLLLGSYPILPAIVLLQVVRRVGNYAITRPSREMLFTLVPTADKYRSKNFIDTVVYRGGDVASGWLFTLLTSVGMSLSAIAFMAAPVALIWAVVAWVLGGVQRRHNAAGNSSTTLPGESPQVIGTS